MQWGRKVWRKIVWKKGQKDQWPNKSFGNTLHIVLNWHEFICDWLSKCSSSSSYCRRRKVYGFTCCVCCRDMKSLFWHIVNTKASLDKYGHQWIILSYFFLSVTVVPDVFISPWLHVKYFIHWQCQNPA
jgi:hypothetical protein